MAGRKPAPVAEAEVEGTAVGVVIEVVEVVVAVGRRLAQHWVAHLAETPYGGAEGVMFEYEIESARRMVD